MNQDQLYRFIFDELDIRGELIYLNQSWEAILKNHDYPVQVQRQLGEAMAAAAILSATIKFSGSLILQIQGKGPLNTLVVQATDEGKLRGVAKWSGQVPENGLRDIYGQGQMLITINSDKAERYQSIVELSGENLAGALENYFQTSEQLASRFWLFVQGKQVAGLFLQQLPSRNNHREDWQRVNFLADTVTQEEILSLAPEQLLHRLFHEEELRLYESSPLSFSCSCSEQKIERTLVAMGKDTLREILEQEGNIKVDCEFCYKHYEFSKEHINELISYSGDAGQIFH